MAYDPHDYNGITNESEERDYHARMEAIEDAREAAKAAERIAEALECAMRDEEEEKEAEFTAWKRANPIEEVLNDWRRAVTTPRYAEIANGLFVRMGDGKRKRRAA